MLLRHSDGVAVRHGGTRTSVVSRRLHLGRRGPDGVLAPPPPDPPPRLPHRLPAQRQAPHHQAPTPIRAGCRATRLQAAPVLTSMSPVSEQPDRWSQATVHPDMWLDPADDPREMEGTSPDGELATLQGYLENYRLTLQLKCECLDAEQLARRSVPPSTMSLLGLLRHLAEAEPDWRSWITFGEPAPRLYGSGDGDFYGAVADQETVDAAY